MDDLISDFVAETNDNLADIHGDLLALENAPDAENIAKIFRFFHTFKGSCGFLNFERLEKLAHTAEDLLNHIDNAESVTTQHISLIYDSVNTIKNGIDAIEENGAEPNDGYEELITRLNNIDDVPKHASPIRKIYDILSQQDQSNVDVPLSEAFKALPAAIDDLNKKLDKKIMLNIEGGRLKCPSNIVQKLKAPILQMVRNAADHGIESPEKRQKIGKDETGIINIVAISQDNQIIIRISDDGQGIDEMALKNEITKDGLATVDDLDAMNQEDILRFIFKSGLSSAGEISQTSGRGVGMDIVHTNITALGGTIEIESQSGHGCCFTIKIPY